MDSKALEFCFCHTDDPGPLLEGGLEMSERALTSPTITMYRTNLNLVAPLSRFCGDPPRASCCVTLEHMVTLRVQNFRKQTLSDNVNFRHRRGESDVREHDIEEVYSVLRTGVSRLSLQYA